MFLEIIHKYNIPCTKIHAQQNMRSAPIISNVNFYSEKKKKNYAYLKKRNVHFPQRIGTRHFFSQIFCFNKLSGKNVNDLNPQYRKIINATHVMFGENFWIAVKG